MRMKTVTLNYGGGLSTAIVCIALDVIGLIGRSSCEPRTHYATTYKSSATAEDGRPYKQLKRLCLHRRCIEYLATGNFYLLA